ncbi:RNA-directed DNA polymerase, eukaryota, reverse transcriptase zinc-binding domain protein [Tanacetum coccineum]
MLATERIGYCFQPLLTKKITAADCKPLVEKVKSRILDWRNKALSYSGRLQLIASVLSAMQIDILGFWEMTRGKAKISWKSICRPKEQGGLGIKNLQVWNEVLLIKQLWNVIAKKDTLWVKWVNSENLKGKSIWVVTAKANSSAGWKEILTLRDKVRKHILWKIGDGMSINTWYDNWCSIGPICDIVTSREIYEARLNIDTTISELANKYEGNWPEGWNIEYPILNQTGMIRRQDGEKDKVVWVDRNGKESIFSVKQVWKDITFDETRVDWYKIVWFEKNIPRHAFVLWMVVQNRLST